MVYYEKAFQPDDNHQGAFMSHEIELRLGKYSFAYNRHNGTPWHNLGTPMDGNQPLAVMLREIGADFFAYPGPVFVQNADGLMVPCDDKIGVMADRLTGPKDEMGEPTPQTQLFAIHGSGYTIVQYEAVAEKALAVVGASEGEAVIDTMGLLYKGEQFFACIDLGDLYIDPMGINDLIERYLAIRSSHDGSIAVTYANSDIRAVCKNTVTAAVESAVRVFKAKHTLKVEDKMAEAQKALGFSTEWAATFKTQAEKLLAKPINSDDIETVLAQTFPIKGDATARQERNNEEVKAAVRGLYKTPKNALGVGENGWALFNAVGEYLDHGRDADTTDRALASINLGGWVSQAKGRAAGAILALDRVKTISMN